MASCGRSEACQQMREQPSCQRQRTAYGHPPRTCSCRVVSVSTDGSAAGGSIAAYARTGTQHLLKRQLYYDEVCRLLATGLAGGGLAAGDKALKNVSRSVSVVCSVLLGPAETVLQSQATSRVPLRPYCVCVTLQIDQSINRLDTEHQHLAARVHRISTLLVYAGTKLHLQRKIVRRGIFTSERRIKCKHECILAPHAKTCGLALGRSRRSALVRSSPSRCRGYVIPRLTHTSCVFYARPHKRAHSRARSCK